MINIDGKEYRNLQEQVKKNQEDIKLLKFGLNIKGRVNDVPDLPADAEIGETYMVGKEAPYYFYIKSAAKTWDNLGKLESDIPGPKGNTGEMGEEGIGILDMNIDEDGVLHVFYTNGDSKALGKIVGEAGPMGLRGEKGNVGAPGKDGIDGAEGPQGPKGDSANPEHGLIVGAFTNSTTDTIQAQQVTVGMNNIMDFIDSSIIGPMNFDYARGIYNPNDPTIEEGKFWVCSTDHAYYKQQNPNFNTSGFMRVNPGEYIISAGSAASGDPYRGQAVFFDEAKTPIDGYPYNVHTTPYFVVPNNPAIKYLQMPVAVSERYTYSIRTHGNESLPDLKWGEFVATPQTKPEKVNFEDLLGFDYVKGVFNPNDIKRGGFYSWAGNWVPDSDFISTGAIPCKAGDTIGSSRWDNILKTQVPFFDKDGNYVTGLNYNQHTHSYVVVPDDDRIAYCKIPINAETPLDEIDYYIPGDIYMPEGLKYGEKYPYFKKCRIDVGEGAAFTGGSDTVVTEGSQWKGKKWYAYGTSMTSIAQGKYVPVVTELSGLITTNKGIPGGGITNNGGYSKGQVKNAIMNTTDGKLTADLITFEVGPNEGPILGEDNIYRMDSDTFCGCFNQCVRYLQENTNAQIVVIPMVGGKDTKPEDVLANGLHADEFHALINRLAYINGVPVIDVFGESGFGYGRVHAGKYQVDNIHLNYLGGDNMGRFVWNKLKMIPTWKSRL